MVLKFLSENIHKTINLVIQEINIMGKNKGESSRIKETRDVARICNT